MDRLAALSERIKARARDEKEAARCRKYSLKLEGTTNTKSGFTASGKRVVFESCFGMTDQSKYGAGTLTVEDGGEWKTVFTKGYPSKALEWMSQN
ncbi:hypothetical protein [Cohnella sp. GbtcB17]|uniref:hypothetical protein n=1 Tax=Cohnella sp. GbtcB17 TaxID=2824762 RepID=UPI001C30C59C|nr:hypothetical protein [Cohnella sp. GbtcB17]